MHEYHVYCDESGNRPTTDDGELSVTGAVFYGPSELRRNFVPEPTSHHHRREPAVMWLGLTEPYASCSLIRPFTGYKDQLDRQMRIMRYGLRREKELKKERRWWIAPEALVTTDFLWLFSMSLMITNALARIAYRVQSPAQCLNLYFDRKDLSSRMKHFFEGHVRFEVIPSIIQGYVIPHGFTSGDDLRKGYQTAQRLMNLKIGLEWRDDKRFSGDRGLLSLADALAHYVQAEMRPNDPVPGFLAELAAAGRGVEYENITQRVLKLGYSSWEARVGENVPLEIINGTGDGL